MSSVVADEATMWPRRLPSDAEAALVATSAASRATMNGFLTTPRGRVASFGMDSSLTELDDGWDFKVLVVDDEWVVRWPRHRLAVEEIEMEVALLPALAPRLPVAVPEFEYVSREPWLVVYRLIRGEPLVDEDPDGVGAFLDALHGIDVTDFPAPRPDWLEEDRELADEVCRNG